MPHQSSMIVRSAATVALLFALTLEAHADTLYVANNGVDGTLCGDQVQHPTVSFLHPCRSISQAIANAAPSDTIIVGPGKYGDLDLDGTLGGTGEETGSPGCGCMLSVNKSVILLSSNGAASTVIDARGVDVAKNVLLILNGGEFGRPGKGFTVTHTDFSGGGDGIVIDSTNVKVRGNQVIAGRVFVGPMPGDGIVALSSGPVLIEGNQVIGWNNGIGVVGTGKTVRKNQVSQNASGIFASGSPTSNAAVIGNVVTGNGFVGIGLEDAASAVGNAVHGSNFGITVAVGGAPPFSGVIERNNVFGNRLCGLENHNVPGLLAKNNYWGARSGPGPDPADDVCNEGEPATTTVELFATTPFIVRAPIRP